MKKYLYILLFSLFLIFPSVVSAKNVTINFDEHEEFNYFYEQQYNTPFYNYLMVQGANLKKTLSNYQAGGCSAEFCNFRIFYLDELDFSNHSDVVVPDNTYYVILADSAVHPLLAYDKNNLYFTHVYQKNDLYKLGASSSSVFYFFDYDANILDSYYVDYGSSFNDVILKSLYDISKDDSAEFTYFISKWYYFDFKSNSFVWSYTDDIVVTDFIIGGKTYIIDNNENYSSFKIFFRALFTSASKYDTSDTILEYFRLYKVYSSNTPIYSLYQMLTLFSDNIQLPEGYVSLQVNMGNGVYLIPKVIDVNGDVDTRIYASATSEVIIKLKYYYIDSVSIRSLGNDSARELKITTFNKIGYIDYLPLSVDNESIKFSNYIYHFSYGFDSIYSSYIPLKSTYTLYYDSSAFDVSYYVVDSGVSFINPFTGEEDLITSKIITAEDFSGSSVNIADFETEVDILGSFDLSVTGIFDTVVSFGFGLVSSVTAVVNLVFVMIDGFPVEVKSMLYFSLVGSVIILIWHLLRK